MVDERVMMPTMVKSERSCTPLRMRMMSQVWCAHAMRAHGPLLSLLVMMLMTTTMTWW